jgi:hypothetical protein
VRLERGKALTTIWLKGGYAFIEGQVEECFDFKNRLGKVKEAALSINSAPFLCVFEK